MKERKLLERFYEKTLTVDTKKSASRAKAAIRTTEAAMPPRPCRSISVRRFAAALSVCVLLIVAIPILLFGLLKKDGSSLPPVIPPPVEVLPVDPPQKHYYENSDVEETNITVDALTELYSGKIDLLDFNLTKITLFCSKEEPDVNLFIRLIYEREQSEEFPAVLCNTDNITLRIILADNAEFYWEENFKDEELNQRLQFSVGGAELDVSYREDWDEGSFAAQIDGEFILNGQKHYVNASYIKIPGLTTENLLEDIIKELLGLV